MRGMFILLIAVLAGISGCGAGSATLSGKVMSKGRPLTQGTVAVFDEHGTCGMAEIQADGSYLIEVCPVGKLKISVTSPDPRETIATINAMKASGQVSPANMPELPKGKPESWFAIDLRYSNPDESGLTVEVSGGSNEHDINLD